jgi:hypothetical protein
VLSNNVRRGDIQHGGFCIIPKVCIFVSVPNTWICKVPAVPFLKILAFLCVEKSLICFQAFKLFIKRLEYLHSRVCSSSKRDLCFLLWCQELLTSRSFSSIRKDSSTLSSNLRNIIINSNFVVRPRHSIAFENKLGILSVSFGSNSIKESLELVEVLSMIAYVMVEVVLIKPVPLFLVKRKQVFFFSFVLVVILVAFCFYLVFSGSWEDFGVEEPRSSYQRHRFFDVVRERFVLL